MGDRGVSTWEAHRWGTDWWASLRAEDGGSSRVVLVCESMHVTKCIWQVELNDTKHLFFRWPGYDPATWTFAGLLLIFSVAVSLLGATDPFPRHGYDHYTAAAAAKNLLHPKPAVEPPAILARQ